MKQRTQLDTSKIGVYLLQTPTGRCYVGMTCDSFERRWSGHRKDLRNGRHRTPALKYTYDKYGWESIEKVILEEWEKPSTIEELELLEKHILKRERYWWEQLASDGANMLHGCPTGTGSVFHSKETKAKLRKNNIKLAMLNPRNIFSEEDTQKIKELFAEGVSKKQIAVDLNKNLKAVGKHIEEKGMKRNTIIYDKNIIYERLLEKHPIIKWHFDEGLSAVEMSSKIGYTSSHISAAIRYTLEKEPNLDNSLAKKRAQEKASKALKNKKDSCRYCKKLFGITVVKQHERSCKDSLEMSLTSRL